MGKPDQEHADDLCERLLTVLNESGESTSTEIWAVMMLLADIVGGLNCAHCRPKQIKFVTETMPKMLAHASRQNPLSGGSDHVH